ncbi:MAG: Lrp/AsnC family transcriptional regulator [Hyphomicrobiales bacterium]|nr:Lrp/AsnC family transcriptional regulator [Hyphomicrobiales bacterium]
MDNTDYKILRALQRDCRQTVAELGEKVGLSPSACHRRVRQLEEDGVVNGYVASLNAKSLGLNLQVFVEISLSSQSKETLEAFEAAVARMPEILECHLISGQADYILRVATRDIDEYGRLHRDRLAQLPGVARMHSNFSLRTVLDWHGYAI